MTITRVWPTGLSDTANLTAADMATLDAHMQRALDKSTPGGTLNSNITFSSSAILRLVNPPGGVLVTGASGFMATASGGRFECGLGDVPVFSSTRSFNRVVQASERANLTATGTTHRWSVDGNNNIIANQERGVFMCPISRAFDGATLASVNVYFVVPGARSGDHVPDNGPSINVYRTDPGGYGIAETLRANVSSVSFGKPASMAAYINGGTPNVMTYTCSINNVIDVSRYAYFFTVTDDDYFSGAAFSYPTKSNRYLGAICNYTGVARMAFQ